MKNSTTISTTMSPKSPLVSFVIGALLVVFALLNIYAGVTGYGARFNGTSVIASLIVIVPCTWIAILYFKHGIKLRKNKE